MARTRRKTGRDGHIDFELKGVRSFYSREAKWARKMTNRRARHAGNAALRDSVDFDAMADMRNRSTGGWITH